MALRNLPIDKPAALASLITAHPHTVSSCSLVKDAGCDLSLFAYGAGESVSEETYPKDALYLVLEGAAVLELPQGPVKLATGEALMVPVGTPHAVCGANGEAFKICQLMA